METVYKDVSPLSKGVLNKIKAQRVGYDTEKIYVQRRLGLEMRSFF